MDRLSRMAARVTRKVPLHESIYKLNEKLNMLMGEMKKLRNVVLQGMAQGQGQGQQAPLQQQEEVELQATEEYHVEPVLARGPGRRSDWHYWAANWAAKNPDVPRDETFSLKMAEAYRAWKDAHPGQSYLDFRGSDVIDGRKRFTQKKGKKVAPAPAPFREPTPPLAPMPFREPTPPSAPFREPTPTAPLREPAPPPAPAPLREATPPAPFREPTPPAARQKTPNKYSPPSAGPLSTPSLLQGRRETPPQEYYDLAEEEQEIPEESVEESVPEDQEELAAEEAEAQAEAQGEEASPEWPQEEEQAELEIVTVGQQEYFRTSNNGLFAVVRDEEGNPEPGPWAGVLSDDGTQVLEVDQPEAP